MHSADDHYIIETKEDVTDLVERNKARQNLDWGKWGEMAQVAEIPPALYWKLWNEGIARSNKDFKKWLNDPANRFFRTRLGSL